MKTVDRVSPLETGGLWRRRPPSTSVTLNRGPAPIQERGTAPCSKSKLQGRGPKRRTWAEACRSPTDALTLPAVVAAAGVVRRPSAEISPPSPSRLQAALSFRMKRPFSSNAQASNSVVLAGGGDHLPGTTSTCAALASAGAVSRRRRGGARRGLERRLLPAHGVEALLGGEVEPAVGDRHRSPDRRETALGHRNELVVQRPSGGRARLHDEDWPVCSVRIELPSTNMGAARPTVPRLRCRGPAGLLVERVQVGGVVDDVDAAVGDRGAGEAHREPVRRQSAPVFVDVPAARPVERRHRAHHAGASTFSSA